MKIHIDDKFIVLTDFNKDEKTLFRGRFTYDDKSKVFAGGSFDSRKIKKVKLINFNKGYAFLFAGFLKELFEFLKFNNIKVEEVEDKRTRFDFQKKEFNTRKYFPEYFTYTEHQEYVLNKMLKTNVGIIKSPTSSGKTAIFIAYLKATRLKALIIMDRVSLVTQTKDRLEKSGFKNVGVAHGNEVKDGDIIVATVYSVRKLPSLTKFQCLLIDEVHKSSSNSFQDFLYNTSFPIRFGFSATPNSGDSFKWAKIRQYMGDIICEIDTNKLIEKKVLAKPQVKFIESKGRPTPDWASAQELCIFKNNNRNNLIIDLVNKYNTSTLILVKLIEHGKHLEEEIEGSIFLSGANNGEERQETINKFENGEIKTIIATSIFNEGISINAIRLLIIASGGKSKIETLQKLGRGLRVDSETGKYNVLVYDFIDKGNKFTLRHSKERAKIYRREGFEVVFP